MKKSDILEKLFSALPTVSSSHSPALPLSSLLKLVARKEVEELFAGGDTEAVDFQPFGELVFPYIKMGAIDSMNLFDIDELIIFSFYWANRKRYRNVADIGGNIGLHSVILSLCGYNVHTYEPDPRNFEVLERNMELNKCSLVETFNAAVSSEEGEHEFTRVLGNLTGSHLTGSKENPYGELEKFPVKLEAIAPIAKWADLIKMDVEGHEVEILKSTKREDWLNTDLLLEVQDEKNAVSIYELFKKMDINLFSQKTNWKKVAGLEDVPTSYREGTLFVTSKTEMPWSEN